MTVLTATNTIINHHYGSRNHWYIVQPYQQMSVFFANNLPWHQTAITIQHQYTLRQQKLWINLLSKNYTTPSEVVNKCWQEHSKLVEKYFPWKLGLWQEFPFINRFSPREPTTSTNLSAIMTPLSSTSPAVNKAISIYDQSGNPFTNKSHHMPWSPCSKHIGIMELVICLNYKEKQPPDYSVSLQNLPAITAFVEHCRAPHQKSPLKSCRLSKPIRPSYRHHTSSTIYLSWLFNLLYDLFSFCQELAANGHMTRSLDTRN